MVLFNNFVNILTYPEALRAKDREHAQLLEEKMALHMKMVGHTGSSTLDVPNTGNLHTYFLYFMY